MLFSSNTFTRRLQALLLVLFVLSMIIILHYIGLSEKLYWSFWWFDIVTHTLGGFAVGLLTSLIYSGRFVWFSIIPILGVLISWELFEIFIVKIKILSVQQYIFDTGVDISVAIVAASFAIYLFLYNSDKNK